jgi:nucleoside-diphosphate-sugar epimerase
MRVFVTGATGFIGSALVPELMQAGHQVLGMTRSEKGAEALAKVGADVHHGTLEDIESLKAGASQVDAVIHLAFNHDFSRFQTNCEDDRKAIEAMGEVLAGSGRPFIGTAGVLVQNPVPGQPYDEDETKPMSLIL